jgi:glutamate decarboxylase
MHKQVSQNDQEHDYELTPTYASRSLQTPLPKYVISDEGLLPDVAYQVIQDELMLEGNAHMNLATFVTTWMEPAAQRLMSETANKNIVDKDEYPQTSEIEKRCVSILAALWNAPEAGTAIGTSTVGSSEACMLAGMALKWGWRARQKVAQLPIDRPNLVLGINAQVCWEKFCRYFDVEIRFVPLEPGRFHLDPKAAAELCDENTIGVVAMLGSTLDGSYEPVAELSDCLDALEKDLGINVPIHVDAASGGFVAPFISPDLVWDFRLLRVKSINVSGHKYGLVYPGVGWVVWRHPDDLPKDLIFNVNYLGGEMPTFNLNFSRPGNAVIAQYYNLIRLGRSGYTQIHQNTLATAQYVAQQLAGMGPFELISQPLDLPVFSFKLTDTTHHFDLFMLSDALRKHGWQVPAYALPKNLDQIVIMRIVAKENFSRDLADELLRAITTELAILQAGKTSLQSSSPAQAFHH